MLNLDDLKTGMPSVFQVNEMLLGHNKNSPGSIRLLYFCPS